MLDILGMKGICLNNAVNSTKSLEKMDRLLYGKKGREIKKDILISKGPELTFFERFPPEKSLRFGFLNTALLTSQMCY